MNAPHYIVRISAPVLYRRLAKEMGLSDADRSVYCFFIQRKIDRKTITVSTVEIADSVGYAPATVRLALRHLKARKMLTWVRNGYRLADYSIPYTFRPW